MYRQPSSLAPYAIFASGLVVCAVDRRTGSPIWQQQLAHALTRHTLSPRIFVENDRVLVTGAIEGRDGWIGMLWCLDYATGQPLWTQETSRHSGDAWHATVLIDGGQVLLAHATEAFAYSLADGTAQWRCALEGGARTGIAASVAIPGVSMQADRQ